STTRSAAAVMPRCASAATATAAPCAPSPTACCRWPEPCSNNRRGSTPPTRFARPPAREHPVPSLCSIENGHPFVPTCLLAERRAQRQSRMPPRTRRHRRSRRKTSLTERARCYACPGRTAPQRNPAGLLPCLFRLIIGGRSALVRYLGPTGPTNLILLRDL